MKNLSYRAIASYVVGGGLYVLGLGGGTALAVNGAVENDSAKMIGGLLIAVVPVGMLYRHTRNESSKLDRRIQESVNTLEALVELCRQYQRKRERLTVGNLKN